MILALFLSLLSLSQVAREMSYPRGDKVLHLSHIDRVLCISDLHTDHAANMNWLKNHTDGSYFDMGESDLIVVAGDISHELERVEESISYLQQSGSSVMFVPGNHEAWLNSSELNSFDSFRKLDKVYELCEKMKVLTGPCYVGNSDDKPHALFIAPLESWYDGSLSVENLDDLCEDFESWPWVDFFRCRWPFPLLKGKNNKIPLGLTQFFIDKNEGVLNKVIKSMSEFNSKSDLSQGLMTVSHFLPNKQCLPDWKDVDSSRFDRESWLDHGGGGISAKFAKVAGTKLLDDQIHSLKLPSSTRQIHLFGHSHRPKDFEKDQIRYIHNPLGKARERELKMVSPDVDFQLVWDTRIGEIPGETIIRLWEEKYGGVEGLRERMPAFQRRSTRFKYNLPS